MSGVMQYRWGFWATGIMGTIACTQFGWKAAAQSVVIDDAGGVPVSHPAVTLPMMNAPVMDVPKATIAPLSSQIETYRSKVLGATRSYGVILPPGYAQSPDVRYPVIVLLHGGHGAPTDWLDYGRATATLQRLYQAEKLPPSLIITPDGNDLRGSSQYWDPQYRDGENGKVATALGDELVQVIRQRYRTLPSSDFWAIGGLSSGGWGALNIGLQFRQHFSVLFSHSGYFADKSGPRNSPIAIVKRLSPQARQRLRIYLDAGKEDAPSQAQAQRFGKVLKQVGIENTVNSFPGSHSWRYWREHLSDSLGFVGEQFKRAQANQAVPSNWATSPRQWMPMTPEQSMRVTPAVQQKSVQPHSPLKPHSSHPARNDR